MNQEKNNSGFIPPIITPDHYVLGAGNVPLDIIQPDGDWTAYLPDAERQQVNGIETYNCTSFGTLNAIEILIFKLTGERVNYSDRFLGLVAGTKEPGNDPQVVCEAIRKYGLIPEAMLPFSDDIKNIDEYYSYKGGDKEACLAEGKKWLAKYDFKHEWAFKPGQPIVEQLNNMRISLKNSPLCMSVYAWASNEKDVYYSLGSPNHWTMSFLVNNYINVLDTYSPFRKLLEQNILYCKRFSIRVRKEGELTAEQATGLLAQLERLWNWLMNIQKQVDAIGPKPLIVEHVEPEPVQIPVKVDTSRFTNFCMAIQQHEGFFKGSRSERNNNPGNCRFSRVGYDPKYGVVKEDRTGVTDPKQKGYAIFNSYSVGYLYLQNLVKSKLNDHPDWNFYDFFGDPKEGWAPSYDHNDSKLYAEVVAHHCGTAANIKVRPFLQI